MANIKLAVSITRGGGKNIIELPQRIDGGPPTVKLAATMGNATGRASLLPATASGSGRISYFFSPLRPDEGV